ncbi:SMODS-associated NUDIX domain-containing protein [Flaviaesturariibacter terrae]
MRRRLAEIFVVASGIGLITYLLLTQDTANPWPAVFVAVLVNIITTPLYVVLVETLFALKNFDLIYKTKIRYRNQDVRMSISYLFRIKSCGKYLLVKNRKGNFYQLVGGAYKALEGAQATFYKYDVKPDRRFHTDHGIAKNDLRFRVPGRNVLNMIRWFNSKENREISQWREFCEELLTTNIIDDKHAFRYIDYLYVTTIQTPIQKARNIDCQEILIFEIFDLVPNDEQAKVLEDLCVKGDTELIKWADEKLIQTLGFDERTMEIEYEIGPHTKWAINKKYSAEK